MQDLAESFTKLLGRQPSDTERQRLYQVRDALGLGTNDALWLVLMALQHYETLYAAYPKLIAREAKAALESFKASADEAARASSEAAMQDLARAVLRAAEDAAREASEKKKALWIASCIAISSLVLGGFGWFMHESGTSAGYHQGFAAGYEKGRDERATSAGVLGRASDVCTAATE